jgi:hypothetical protein
MAFFGKRPIRRLNGAVIRGGVVLMVMNKPYEDTRSIDTEKASIAGAIEHSPAVAGMDLTRKRFDQFNRENELRALIEGTVS